MKDLNIQISKYKTWLVGILFFCSLTSLSAQDITGDTKVCTSINYEYTINKTGGSWQVTGGNLISSEVIYSGKLAIASKATVSWNAASTQMIGYSIGKLENYKIYTYTRSAWTPLSLSASTDCTGDNILVSVSENTFDPNYETGTYKWYRYDPFAGQYILLKSTSSKSTSIPVSSIENTYYVSKTYSDGCETSKQSVTTTITSVLNPPTFSNLSRCGSGTTQLTVSNHTSGAYYKLYTSGGSYIKSYYSSSFTLPSVSSTTYYQLSAVKSGCESNKSSFHVTINALPPTPVKPTLNVNCSNSMASLVFGNQASGYTYYWVTPSGDIAANNSDLTLTQSGTYALKAKNNSTGCWSNTSQSVTVTFPLAPISVTTPQVSIDCQNNITKLLFGSQPSGFTYYWVTPSGEVAANNADYTATTTGTYALKAKNLSTGCEKISSSVSVIASPKPPTPANPLLNIGCEGSLAEISMPAGLPSGYDYFWQTSSTGTEETNSQTTFTTSTSGTYYLRAKNINSGCWSNASSTGAFTLSQTAVGTAWNSPEDTQLTLPTESRPTGKTLADVNPHFVQSFTMTQGIKNVNDIHEGMAMDKALISRQYSDGFGRPVQSITRRISPDGFDVVQLLDYDAYGRQNKAYMSYVSSATDGNFRTDAIGEQYDFYNNTSDDIADSNFPYARVAFENSPYSKVKSQYAPGASWTGDNKGQHFSNRSNTFEEVKKFNLGTNGKPENNGYYAAGDLLVSKVVSDINGTENHMVLSYFNESGQLVAKKQISGGTEINPEYSEIYFVYDNTYERLAYILPPKAVEEIGNGAVTDDILNKYAFHYQYDFKHRLISKKIPGKGNANGAGGETYIVYDKLNRPVLSQDANQRQNNQWSFVKYDVTGRTIMTGNIIDSRGRVALQAEADKTTNPYELFETKGGTFQDYTNNAFPAIAQNDILTVSYYDDYNFTGAKAVSNTYDSFFEGNIPQPFYRIRGLATASKTKMPETDEWLLTQVFYDQRGRAFQILSDNHLGGEDMQLAVYDFTGQVLKAFSHHQGYQQIDVSKTYAYDHVGRLLKITQQINNDNTETLAEYQYNKIGQLVKKKLGTDVQEVDFKYNFRGWLTDINDVNATLGNGGDLFAMHLDYEQGFEKKRLDGSISGAKWKSASDNKTRAYGYSYDKMGRLQRADYVAQDNNQNWNAEQNRFSVFDISYDANGNVQTLSRQGLNAKDENGNNTFGAMDRLNYSYKGNRLATVDDYVVNTGVAGDFNDTDAKSCLNPGTDEYTYDQNGNLTSDVNKDISSIVYNHFDLPETITFGNASENKVIKFNYDGAGTKLSKEIFDGDLNNPIKKIDYLGAIVYENGKIAFIHTEEGRALPLMINGEVEDQTSFNYEYHIKDQQGNQRVAVTNGAVRYKAGMETEDQQTEEKYFTRISDTQITGIANTGSASSLLPAANANEPVVVGPTIRIRVKKGDKIKATAWSFYQSSSANTSYTYGNSNIYNPSGDGGQTITTGTVNTTSGGTTVPNAYLKMVYEPDGGATIDDSNAIEGQAGVFTPMSAFIFEDIPNDGYMTLFVANESDADVIFDDFIISHYQLMSQENQYDATGMNLAGIENYNGERTNFYQYNASTEKETAHGLNWYETPFRSFDVQLMRFHQVDKMAETYISKTPYNYAGNDPVNVNDPTGLYEKEPQYDFNQIINNLFASDYGGQWTRSGGYNEFSESELEDYMESQGYEAVYKTTYKRTGGYWDRRKPGKPKLKGGTLTANRTFLHWSKMRDDDLLNTPDVGLVSRANGNILVDKTIADEYDQAIAFLKQFDFAREVIDFLEKHSDKSIKPLEIWDIGFNNKHIGSDIDNLILWAPKVKLVVKEGNNNALPPVISLLHELGHAYLWLKNPEIAKEMAKPNGTVWHTDSDEWTIKNLEHKLAKALGFPRRKSHGGGYEPTLGIFSTTTVRKNLWFLWQAKKILDPDEGSPNNEHQMNLRNYLLDTYGSGIAD